MLIDRWHPPDADLGSVAIAIAAGAFAPAATIATLAVLAGPTGWLFLAAGGLCRLVAITVAVGWWVHRRSMRNAAPVPDPVASG